MPNLRVVTGEWLRGSIRGDRGYEGGSGEDLRKTISELTAQISALALSGKVNAGRLYGRKSEKSSRLGKRRDDDDRNSGKNNFDGTAGSDSGANTEVPRNNPSSGDTVSAIQKRLLRTHPGSEVKLSASITRNRLHIRTVRHITGLRTTINCRKEHIM